MKKFTIIMLVLLGCQEPFDIDEYIEESCTGDATETMWIHRSCGPDWVVEEIVDSIEYINDTLNIDIQVCGYEWFYPGENQVISCDLSPAPLKGRYTIGRCTQDKDIIFWPMRINSKMEMSWIVTHELGHMLGAGHSDDNNHVMYSDWAGVTQLSDVDIEMMGGVR